MEYSIKNLIEFSKAKKTGINCLGRIMYREAISKNICPNCNKKISKHNKPYDYCNPDCSKKIIKSEKPKKKSKNNYQTALF